LIVVDASALVAIAAEEPDRHRYIDALERSDAAHLAAPNYLEAGLVLVRRNVVANRREFDTWLKDSGVIVRADLPLATDALDAYLRYGKGLHPARLNLADCFAYALAKTLDAPLLYKGDDFAQTDIRSALQPT
jgi:ribonuclease VapC